MEHLDGTGASSGTAIGSVLCVARERPVVPEFADNPAAYSQASTAVAEDLEALKGAALSAGRSEAAEILGAQALMASDPLLAGSVADLLGSGRSLGEAIDEASTQISSVLAQMEDEYLAARAADVQEIAERIRHKLAGTSGDGLGSITTPVVVVADALTAADTARLDPEVVLGFITQQGGPTSHVAVIARALGIPAVVGVEGAIGHAQGSLVAALDGDTGDVVFDPDDAAIADFQDRAEKAAARARIASRYRGKKVEYAGRTVKVAANVGGLNDIERAVAAEADGIGLFRTEFLFLDRDAAPTEDEQYHAYVAAVSSFADPVVIRTLDIGGDKPAPYLNTPVEDNPFLGERGVRLYSLISGVFRSQVRALLRAAVHGDLWVMVPMVSTLDDLLEVKRAFADARQVLADAGTDHRMPKIGVMIEVPSAAVAADGLAAEADFFSIGTNDLTQYTLAADRMNGRLARYSDAANPAVLGLCRLAAEAAARAGIPVSVCGEAAADATTGALFVAMGADKLSVAPPAVNRVKAMLDELNAVATSRAMDEALAADSAQSVRSIMGELLGESPL